MNIGNQIKKYREQLEISQEELADKIFVTRQTISNWENNKNYPDIKSLSLLSYNLNVSLDDLIKGDVEKMKEIIDEKEIKKLNLNSKILTICFAVLILLAVPLFIWLERYAFIPMGIVFIITMFCALKVEKLKKDKLKEGETMEDAVKKARKNGVLYLVLAFLLFLFNFII